MNSPSRKKIVELLQKEKIVSGEVLAASLKISRQALHKQIQSLRKKGYEIQGKKKTGYSLTSQPDLLNPDQILSGLTAQNLGRNIVILESVDSTQNKAKELAQKGAAEGTLVAAEKQTEARGRFARKWFSEKGGIWASLILRPNLKPHEAPVLSLLFSLSISNAIDEHLKIKTKLKWPNDIWALHGKKHKKICGILTEMSAETDRVNWIILGFGINANNALPLSLKNQAAALKEIAGESIDRNQLLAGTLNHCEKNYLRFLKEGFKNLKEDYTKKSVLIGQKVEVSGLHQNYTGLCMGIDEDGAIILATTEQQIKLYSGDVTLHI